MRNQALLALLFLFILGCGDTGLQNQDYSETLSFGKDALQAEFTAWNAHPDSTLITFKIRREPLLYQKDETIGAFLARVLIRFQAYPSFSSKAIADSSSLQITDTYSNSNTEFIIGETMIKTSITGSYYLKVATIDQNRGNKIIKSIRIDRASVNSPNNFRVTKNGTQPMFRNWVGTSTNVTIEHSTNLARLFVRYYDRQSSLPPPPFSRTKPRAFRYTADATYPLNQQENGTFLLSLKKPGIYHIQADSSNKQGLLLMRAAEGYPKITDSKDLLEPVRFLTSTDQYKSMAQSESPKVAVESFWLSHAGSKERARELIKRYYSRVERANILFTSFK